MGFSDLDALRWIQGLISFSLILQTIEFLQLRKTFSSGSIWDWEILKQEFESAPKPLYDFLNFILSNKNFSGFLVVRLVLATLTFVFPSPIFIFVLFLSTILISLRWRGSFNGGSDFMTLVVLMALLIATTFPEHPKVRIGCLWYIALQTCTSYFIAGIVKLQKKNWRTGRALKGFLSSTIYRPGWLESVLQNHPGFILFSSWFIMMFECAFPLALLHPKLCTPLLGIAFVFHLANAYVFGLNRFLFAWVAAYPALYFCSISVSSGEGIFP